MELLAGALTGVSGEVDAPPAPRSGAGPDILMLRPRPSPHMPPPGVEPGRLLCEQGFAPYHAALAGRGLALRPELGAADAREGGFALVCVALTRSRDEARANVARAWDLAAPGAPILVAGAKTDGVESLQKALKKAGLSVSAAPRRHGRVLTLHRDGARPAIFDDWLAAAAMAPRVEAEIAGERRRFQTCAGLFSWDRVDAGSALLAQALPPLSGRVADLGAGWGYLSAAILANPEVVHLDLAEAERAALDAARLNIEDARAAFHWADIRALPLPAGGHDAVVANPPFHEGREVSLALGQAFVAAGARLLKPSGRMWIVANRTLPYEDALDAHFIAWREVGDDRAYKILEAERPRPPVARSGGRSSGSRSAAKSGSRGAGQASGRGRGPRG